MDIHIKVYKILELQTLIDDNDETNELFIESFSMVSVWGSHLTPEDDTIWDISPNSIGNVDDDTYPTDFPTLQIFIIITVVEIQVRIFSKSGDKRIV